MLDSIKSVRSSLSQWTIDSLVYDPSFFFKGFLGGLLDSKYEFKVHLFSRRISFSIFLLERGDLGHVSSVLTSGSDENTWFVLFTLSLGMVWNSLRALIDLFLFPWKIEQPNILILCFCLMHGNGRVSYIILYLRPMTSQRSILVEWECWPST